MPGFPGIKEDQHGRLERISVESFIPLRQWQSHQNPFFIEREEEDLDFLDEDEDYGDYHDYDDYEDDLDNNWFDDDEYDNYI